MGNRKAPVVESIARGRHQSRNHALDEAAEAVFDWGGRIAILPACRDSSGSRHPVFLASSSLKRFELAGIHGGASDRRDDLWNRDATLGHGGGGRTLHFFYCVWVFV